MTVNELIQMLQQVKDKEQHVVMELHGVMGESYYAELECHLHTMLWDNDKDAQCLRLKKLTYDQAIEAGGNTLELHKQQAKRRG